MGDDEKKRTSIAKRLGATVLEEAAAAVPGTIIGALAGDAVGAAVGGAAGAIGVGLVSVFHSVRMRSVEKRRQRFESELERLLLEDSDLGSVAQFLEQNEEFGDVVFQNFRRAVDAVSPEVVPALAKLTSLYKKRPPDAFLRSFGFVLQELDADEFGALRILMSSAEKMCREFSTPRALIIPVYEKLVYFESLAARHRDEQEGYLAQLPQGGLRVLDLFVRFGVISTIDGGGTDLAVSNQVELALETIEKIRSIVGPSDVAVEKFRSKESLQKNFKAMYARFGVNIP